MRNLVIIFSLILVLTFFSFPQEIIENPEKPLSKEAGRIVNLKEFLSIHDTGDDYYFKYPSNLKIAPDGSIFVLDWSSSQLVRFDTNGKFLRNYFKKGQGPGELNSVGDYCFDDDNIIIYDARLQKILWLNFNGKTVKEFKVRRTARAFMFKLYHYGTYHFIQYDIQNLFVNQKKLWVMTSTEDKKICHQKIQDGGSKLIT
jgi:hypothetical protein